MRFPQPGKYTTIYSSFDLDAAIELAQNPISVHGPVCIRDQRRSVRYLPGWTVQCINPECLARGHWLRVDAAPEDLCSNCGEPLQNVPPPLSPQLRLRPRPLTSYRPNRRAR